MAVKNQSIIKQAFFAYLLAVIFSVIFWPLFDKIYKLFFVTIPGDGFGVWGNWWVFGLIQNTFFALPFFIPLFVMILIKRKQWLVWLIGALVVFVIFYLGESKQSLWFLIFTISGFVLGWVIKIIYQKIIVRKA